MLSQSVFFREDELVLPDPIWIQWKGSNIILSLISLDPHDSIQGEKRLLF